MIQQLPGTPPNLSVKALRAVDSTQRVGREQTWADNCEVELALAFKIREKGANGIKVSRGAFVFDKRAVND
jgi:hypothetical protein